jgi:hypothetical protein
LASSATPSTFQNAVAASTRRASSALTASKPIVVVFTLSGSPPSPATTERSTATSDGSPLTPARLPSRSRGRLIAGWASTDASGRCTTAITPTMSRFCSRARARSWMSRIAMSTRPPWSRRSASVDAPGAFTSRLTPSASS